MPTRSCCLRILSARCAFSRFCFVEVVQPRENTYSLRSINQGKWFQILLRFQLWMRPYNYYNSLSLGSIFEWYYLANCYTINRTNWWLSCHIAKYCMYVSYIYPQHIPSLLCSRIFGRHFSLRTLRGAEQGGAGQRFPQQHSTGLRTSGCPRAGVF
jgi:hypothetical protein